MAGNPNWEYAQMASEAKKYGGPEMYMKKQADSNQLIGEQRMYPWIGGAFAGGFCLAGTITVIVMNIMAHNKEKQLLAEMQAKEASDQLIKGMREYEAKAAEATEEISTEENEENAGSDNVADKEDIE